MIENNPIDLANSMARYEKRAKAIALLKGTPSALMWETFLTIACYIGVMGGGFFLSQKGIIPTGAFLLLVFVAALSNGLIAKLFETRRQVQALTELVLLRETEAEEARQVPRPSPEPTAL